MDLTNRVKNLLRMCGHAMVSTIHDRLNVVDRVLQDIVDQSTHIANTQTALLQSELHLVEKMAQTGAELQQIKGSVATQDALIAQNLASLKSEVHQLSVREQDPATPQSLVSLESEIHRLEVRLQTQDPGIAQSLASLESAARETKRFLADQSVRQVSVETSDYFATNPELGLLSFLYSYLPSRTVLDIGAHVGDVSEHLLKTGYEVYAFEPYPESFRRLNERLRSRSAFHPSNLALGSVSGEMPLHLVSDHSPDNQYEDPTVFYSLSKHGMPTDLIFQGSVPVKVRTLSELHHEGQVPEDVSLVKIDTEGYDLEVIRGMGDRRYPAVMVEFWDHNIPFAAQGLRYTLESMVCEMQQRGYFWYIVIYRLWGENHTAFFCNHDRSVPNSWGNILFFQDREVFAQAQNWCSAVLPRTYFKHVPADAGRAAHR